MTAEEYHDKAMYTSDLADESERAGNFGRARALFHKAALYERIALVTANRCGVGKRSVSILSESYDSLLAQENRLAERDPNSEEI